MTCDCIEKIKKGLEDQGYEKPLCEDLGIDFTTGCKMIGIPFSFLERKKNGDVKKRPSNLTLVAAYCPFCGKEQEKT